MGKKKGHKSRTPEEVKKARMYVRLGFGIAGAAVGASPLINGVRVATSNFTQAPSPNVITDIALNYGVDPRNGSVNLGQVIISTIVLPFIGVQIGKVGGRVAKAIR